MSVKTIAISPVGGFTPPTAAAPSFPPDAVLVFDPYEEFEWWDAWEEDVGLLEPVVELSLDMASRRVMISRNLGRIFASLSHALVIKAS